MKRRRFLTALASVPILGILALAYAKWLEPSWFEVTEKDIKLRHLSRPLKLLHLSDFHASPEVSLETIEAAIELGLQQNPDFAVISGDFITWELGNEAGSPSVLRGWL